MLKSGRQKIYTNKIKSECKLGVSARTIRKHLKYEVQKCQKENIFNKGT